MSGSEEEDYMSEKWLQQLAEEERKLKSSAQKVHGSTSHRHTRTRIQESSSTPSRSELEKMLREQGMNREIEEENKGYELLKKMGYEKGMSLGGRPDKSGLLNPITVNFKTSK
jgi:hypothetical protein